MIKRIGDLELDEDIPLQRRLWIMQRIGRWMMLAIILAAGLGLLGMAGPLSQAIAGTESAFQVEYLRLVRRAAPVDLRVRIWPSRLREGKARIWFDQDFISQFKIQPINPEPENVRVEDGTVVFEFPAKSEAKAFECTFHLTSKNVGTIQGRVGVVGFESVDIRQFGFP